MAVLSSFLALGSGAGGGASVETTPQERAKLFPAILEVSSVTVKGTYSLLPCAFSRSLRTQLIERSFDGGCPALSIVEMVCSSLFSSLLSFFTCSLGWAKRETGRRRRAAE